MFVGFYRVRYIGPSMTDTASPTTGHFLPAGSLYDYSVVHDPFLAEYAGRLFINWGDSPSSKRAWFQLASNQEKPIVEIKREYSDPAFPGYLQFIDSLSRIATLPPTWIEMLKVAKGVYVLTFPRTKELYIGSATGSGGFFGRCSTHEMARERTSN